MGVDLLNAFSVLKWPEGFSSLFFWCGEIHWFGGGVWGDRREIYLKELAYVIVGAGKSKVCRAG